MKILVVTPQDHIPRRFLTNTDDCYMTMRIGSSTISMSFDVIHVMKLGLSDLGNPKYKDWIEYNLKTRLKPNGIYINEND